MQRVRSGQDRVRAGMCRDDGRHHSSHSVAFIDRFPVITNSCSTGSSRHRPRWLTSCPPCTRDEIALLRVARQALSNDQHNRDAGHIVTFVEQHDPRSTILLTAQCARLCVPSYPIYMYRHHVLTKTYCEKIWLIELHCKIRNTTSPNDLQNTIQCDIVQ